jgi:hypothetical protein
MTIRGFLHSLKRVRFVEHLAVASPTSLENFCSIVAQELDLPNFAFGASFAPHQHLYLLSGEYGFPECGYVEKRGIEYNISRHSFEPETLHLGSPRTFDCNFGIALMVSNNCPESASVAWGSSKLVPRVAQRLANALGQKVHHYRTSLRGAKSIERDRVFRPANWDS